MQRAILIVMDSLGVGAMPDAADYGDAGADTFGHIAAQVPDLAIPHLQALGFGNIPHAAGGRFSVADPKGACCRLAEQSKGKDTTTGHWEIAGLETMVPSKTYPEGFPAAFIEKFQEAIGRQVLGNYPASGTVIIEELGDEHEATGKPIVYTSADSVFQIAANTAVIPLEELYHMCEVARKMLVGEWACGRVIARPYIKVDGKRVRTSDRRDYSVAPPDETMLDIIKAAGQPVDAVGKIHDIFDGRGMTKTVHTTDNMDGVDKTIAYMKEDDTGLLFTNLVDFDAKYGHRRDPAGYGQAIMDFDRRIPEILDAMKPGDVLMLTADHGNDPIHAGTDHTREYIPFVAYGKDIRPVVLEDRKTFADIGATICQGLGVPAPRHGTSFLDLIVG